MKPALLTLYGEGELLDNLRMHLQVDSIPIILDQDFEEEIFISIKGPIKDRVCLIFESFYNPPIKILPLLFLIETLRDLGAKKIGLIAPFLPYMHHNKQLQVDNKIFSSYFAKLLSQYVDWLVTVDFPLPSISITDMYSIPTQIVHVEEDIADWVQANIKKPVIIGMHNNARIEQIAKKNAVPYLTMEQVMRYHQDHILYPELNSYASYTPVLFEEMITTGKILTDAMRRLERAGLKSPVCISIHGLFVNDTYQTLLAAGASQIVTCNTIAHFSNQIDVSAKLAQSIELLLEMTMLH